VPAAVRSFIGSEKLPLPSGGKAFRFGSSQKTCLQVKSFALSGAKVVKWVYTGLFLQAINPVSFAFWLKQDHEKEDNNILYNCDLVCKFYACSSKAT
jgi:hypothetical protein